MQKIVPCLWFDTEAEEAANFYTSIFNNGKVTKVMRYGTSGSEVSGQAAGSVLTADFEIEGFRITALNGGPVFKLNPSISFMVNFDPSREENARGRLDAIWAKLSEGGTVRMPLQKYDFSEWYGWIEDKYGVSWQLILTDPEGDERPTIIPALLFVKENCGKAEEASDFYLSVFKNAKRGLLARYPAGQEPDAEGTVMFTDFILEDVWFAAMDSAHEHPFEFNEAFSFMINCETQEEMDALTEKLSAVPESEQCGWVKDRYGVSWQIIPTVLEAWLSDPDPEKAERTMKSMLQMKRLNIEALRKAYEGA